MNTVTTRVIQCPDCGGVLMGYGPMGSTRKFECLNCGTETTKSDSEGTYIEREIPSSVFFHDVDGPIASYNVDSSVSFDEFMREYPTPKYQR